MYRHAIFFHVPLLYFDYVLAVGFCRIKTKNLVLLRLETNDHSEEARQLISNLPGVVSFGGTVTSWEKNASLPFPLWNI